MKGVFLIAIVTTALLFRVSYSVLAFGLLFVYNIRLRPFTTLFHSSLSHIARRTRLQFFLLSPQMFNPTDACSFVFLDSKHSSGWSIVRVMHTWPFRTPANDAQQSSTLPGFPLICLFISETCGVKLYFGSCRRSFPSPRLLCWDGSLPSSICRREAVISVVGSIEKAVRIPEARWLGAASRSPPP